MTKMTNRMRMSVALGAILLAAVAACGDDGGGASGDDAGGAGNELSVAINEPADGDSIEMPFMLRLDSGVELGPPESGKHHVHLYFDGDDSKYEVIESAEVEVTDASPAVEGLGSGEHELNVSLRNADHSPAGFETKVMVQVGGEQEDSPDDGGTGGGY